MLNQAAITLTVALSAYSAAAATIDRRVVGGEDAKEGEFPFVVSINTKAGICGGALLDSTTVLTASHCLWDPVSVRAGSLQHESGGVESNVASWIAHPEYARNNRDKTKPYANNDIAILKLATPIEAGDKISYATLAADGSDPVPGSMSMFAGWGKQEPAFDPSGKAAKNMARVTMPIHAREVCDKLDRDVKGRDTVLCVGGEGKTPCRYDSGGPLIDQQTGQVIGVASWGLRDKGKEGLMCSQAPMIYTRVGSYRAFIDEHLAGPEAGPRAQEDALCSTADKPNKYGVSEDECRRTVAQCVFEQSKENKVVSNFAGVVKCVDAKFA